MTTGITNKNVLKTFSQRVFLIILISAISISILFAYFSYSEFKQNSKKIETAYINSQKQTLQQEVSNVERIINYKRSKLDQLVNENIKQRVYYAHTIATHLYNKYKKTKSRAELESIIIEALRPQRFFAGRGYFYAISLNGTGKLNPITPQLEGTNMLSLKTKKDVYFIKELINVAKNKGEGFYRHTWTKPDKKGEFNKVSFVKQFKPLNWLIGTGDYVSDVEQQIKQNILDQIGEIQFGKEGYIFVVNYDGNVMMNRGNRSLIGKNILHIKDTNGVSVAKEVIKLAQTPGWDGFFSYTWKKLSSENVSQKVAYHKMVPDWGWYYGAGVYLDDINTVINQQKDQLRNSLIFDLFLLGSALLLAIILIYRLAQRNSIELKSDLDKLLDFFQHLSIKSKPLNTDSLVFSELKQLSDSANVMLENQKTAAAEKEKFQQQLQQSQKMDAVSQVVGGVAHDFNNLLGVILGFGEILESKLTNDSKLLEYCRQINVAGLRGAKLTRKLLSLTRQQATEAESCNVNELLNEEKNFLHKSLTAKINLKYKLNNDVWPVWIDRSDFEDAILNLCVNAMHAMKEGQQDSSILIKTNNIVIDQYRHEFSSLEPGDYVQVSIIDNGVGMTRETEEKIFEPFYTTRETGTGLGLSQVYSFASRSNGGIFVETKVGDGTTFTLLFPRYSAVINNESPAKVETNILENDDEANNLSGTEVILVVDDEPALRKLSADILTQHGYTVLQAEDGIDALGLLESGQIDLVLSDVIMPNMDGNLLAEKIQRIYPDIKIQLLSGYTDNEQMSEVNAELYKNILKKPLDSKILLKRIRALLNQK